MTHNSLTGLQVLVTRPVDQAKPFSDIILEHGGRAVRLPVIEIHALNTSETIVNSINRLGDSDTALS